MGNRFSICSSAYHYDSDPNDWKDWDAHPAFRRYVVGKQIGSGGFSEVYLAKRKPLLFDGEEVALKVIFLGNPKLADAAKELLRAESTILQRLHHPHVVDVRRTLMWHAKQILVIEEEMLHGEELLTAVEEAIADYGFEITESFTALVMRQVLLALAYLHSWRVLHRDVKTENLRLTRPTKEWVADRSSFKLKLIDFGLSCVMEGKEETGLLGTAGYVAPEVIDGRPHSPAMDVYAAGVVLFILLTGMKPTEQEQAQELLYSGLEAQEYPNMHGNPRWEAVSASAQSLVLQLLQRNPRDRPSAQQALQHKFLRKSGRAREVAPAVPSEPPSKAGTTCATPSVSVLGTSDCSSPQYAMGLVSELHRQANALKETDNLQVDADTVKSTMQAERWREIGGVICQMRSVVAASSPTSSSTLEAVPSDVATLWQQALRRGYVRAQRNTYHFSAGRITAAPPPRPTLPRSLSLTALQSAAATSVAGGSAGTATPLRHNASMPVLTAMGSPASFTRSSTLRQGTQHKRAVAHEQLEHLLEECACANKDTAEDLLRLGRVGST
eukprot:jgi/Ulvmu1/5957/UM026_0079.1